MINTCKACGLPFRKLTKKHLYCIKCKNKGISYYNKNPIVTKTCAAPNCDKEFDTNLTKKKYCSDKCRNDADVRSRPSFKATCQNCGLHFDTTKINKKYCSEFCYLEHKAKEAKNDYKLSGPIGE